MFGVEEIQFLREIQAEVMNEIQNLLFGVHSPGCPPNYCPHHEMHLKKKNQGLQLGLNRCQSLFLLHSVNGEGEFTLCCSVIRSLYLYVSLSVYL